MSKWSHFILWPVMVIWSATAEAWLVLVSALEFSVFLSYNRRFVFPMLKALQSQQPALYTTFDMYKAGCLDCNAFYIGKTKRRLYDRKTEHSRALTSTNHASAVADHMTMTGHRIKWDHFDIFATGRSDVHCKIRETWLIRDLQPVLNENVGSEKLLLC